jgi:hypothetical protein
MSLRESSDGRAGERRSRRLFLSESEVRRGRELETMAETLLR